MDQPPSSNTSRSPQPRRLLRRRADRATERAACSGLRDTRASRSRRRHGWGTGARLGRAPGVASVIRPGPARPTAPSLLGRVCAGLLLALSVSAAATTQPSGADGRSPAHPRGSGRASAAALYERIIAIDREIARPYDPSSVPAGAVAEGSVDVGGEDRPVYFDAADRQFFVTWTQDNRAPRAQGTIEDVEAALREAASRRKIDRVFVGLDVSILPVVLRAFRAGVCLHQAVAGLARDGMTTSCLSLRAAKAARLPSVVR